MATICRFFLVMRSWSRSWQASFPTRKTRRVNGRRGKRDARLHGRGKIRYRRGKSAEEKRSCKRGLRSGRHWSSMREEGRVESCFLRGRTWEKKADWFTKMDKVGWFIRSFFLKTNRLKKGYSCFENVIEIIGGEYITYSRVQRQC